MTKYAVIAIRIGVKYTTIPSTHHTFTEAEKVARELAEEWDCRQSAHNQWENDASIVKVEEIKI